MVVYQPTGIVKASNCKIQVTHTLLIKLDNFRFHQDCNKKFLSKYKDVIHNMRLLFTTLLMRSNNDIH
ncbi:unnamed protein product, partial [Heterobilharzia americana]